MASSAQNSSFTPFEPTLPEGFELHDDYIIEKVLGEGAFGITYLAKEKMTDYTVVLKENHPSDFAYRDPTTGKLRSKRGKDDDYQWALKSFEKEARTLRKLPKHTNLVHVTGVFRALNTAYIVMEPIDGKNLAELYPIGSKMEPQLLEDLLHKLLNALEPLHRQGIIHRDIKPANIMLTPAGEPVLIDFGAARPMEGTHTATQIGTREYAPPEQLENTQLAENAVQPTPQPHWDLYALGSTCHQLITGYIPVSEARSLSERPELQGLYSSALLASIDKAHAKSPADRWQSAQQWLDELEAEHRRKQEEEHRQKVEEEQQRILRELEAEKLIVAAAQAALRAAEEKAKQAESALHTAEEKAKQAETARQAAEEKAKQAKSARQAAEEKAKQAEAARQAAEEKARQAEANRRTAEEKARLAEEKHNSSKIFVSLFKYSAIIAGILLAGWLTLGYTIGPVFASRKNYPTLLRSFLYLPKIDVNKADKYGETPLHKSAYKGHTECVKQLIEAKADVNKATNSGSTPLYWAALWGHTECVKQLLAAGADVNIADNRGDTPLCWAAKNGHTECVKLLLAAGADVNMADKYGYTPLHVAKTEEIKRLLREAAEKKPATEQADENEPQAVPEQEAAKSRLQQQNNTLEKYNTALLEAAEKGNSELLSQLLTAGADVNTADKDGWTSLHKAARGGYTECVKQLIAAGADVNKANKDGDTPLYWAAYEGRTECVKQLIAARANVNKASKDGLTPLYWAACIGHTECVKLLIAAGADVNKAHRHGFTPLSVAKTKEIKRLLRAAGAK